MRTLVLPGQAPMKLKQFGAFDDLSNRRNLWRMLDRLGDGVLPEVGCQRRLDFLRWCAKQCEKYGYKGIQVKASIGTTKNVYWCMAGLATSYELDLDEAATVLERWLSRLER